MIRVAARLAQPLHVAEQKLDERGEVVAVGRRLRRLAVGVRHDERVRGSPPPPRAAPRSAPAGRRAARPARSLSAILNTVWSMSFRLRPGVELPGRLDARGAARARSGRGRRSPRARRCRRAPATSVPRSMSSSARRIAPASARLRRPCVGQHDRARPVDPHLLAPVVLLHALEERGEHRLPVHRRREPSRSRHASTAATLVARRRADSALGESAPSAPRRGRRRGGCDVIAPLA